MLNRLYDELVKKVDFWHSDLVKKADYDTKIDKVEMKIFDHDHHDKYVATQVFDKLAEENLLHD